MTKRIVALMLLVGIGGVGWVLANRRKPAPLPAALVVERPPYDSTRLAKTIAFYEGRVKSDPIAAIDSAALAGLYVQRCRETGDIEDALRGEKAARHSLAIRRRYNAAAYDGLAQIG